MYLQLSYTLLLHPYSSEPGSHGEIWARIALEVRDEHSQDRTVKTAFDWQWDILVFLEWIVENKKYALYEELPKFLTGKSIAESIWDFYDRPDFYDLPDEVIEEVYEYRTRHDVGFGLSGTDIDGILIGLKDGCYSISSCSEVDSWSCQVSLDRFYDEVEELNTRLRGAL